jgi:hypothetical protein
MAIAWLAASLFMPVSRVLITGDLLRPHPDDPSRSESLRRIRWFEDLLAPAIGQVTELPVGRLACEGALDVKTLYADAGTVPSPDAWAALYAGELPPRLASRLGELCQDALVIGIELPPAVAEGLVDAGIPVLDCVVDPLRFLDDIPLSWRASDPAVRAAIEPFRMSQFEVARGVARIRAKSRWIHDLDLAPGATLVLDQVSSDSAMIDPLRRRRVGWEDYLDELVALRSAGPVVWRPHPHGAASAALEAVLGDAPRADGNFYHLLCRDELTGVVAISSGGVVEARTFGKHGRHLLDRHAGIWFPGWATPVPVLGHWISPHFWSSVLRPLVPTRDDVPVVPVEKSFHRRSINCEWEFSWIDQVVAR